MTLSEELSALLDAAEQEHKRTTPGPWTRSEGSRFVQVPLRTISGGQHPSLTAVPIEVRDHLDAEYIAHEHERLPEIIEKARELIAENERLGNDITNEWALRDDYKRVLDEKDKRIAELEAALARNVDFWTLYR